MSRGDDMSPGREMDALVAERVMGATVTWETVAGFDSAYEVPYTRTVADPLPYYSTDIAAAWQVVEAIYVQGFGLTLAQTRDGWRATLEHYTGPYVVANAEVAPLAICEAALKAAALASLPVAREPNNED